MFWSLCYVVLRRVLQLAALRFRASCCRERAGARLSSLQRRCFAGTVGWSPSAGRIRDRRAGRRSAPRSGSWCFASAARTRGGVISGSLASFADSASRSPPRLCASCFASLVWALPGSAWDSPGANSCERRPTACSLSTSSPSKPLPAAAVRALLHRARQPARASRRLHLERERRLGYSAGPSARLGISRPFDIDSLPDPRSRQQVHARVRHRLPKRRNRDHPDAGPSAAGERGRRTLHPHRPIRMPRLAPDRQPPPSRAGTPRLRRPLQRPPAAPSAQPHAT